LENSAQLSGIEKASLMLVTLGAKSASNVLRHLSPDEVQRLAAQVAVSKEVGRDVQEQVMEEFALYRRSGPTAGGLEYAKEILEQSLGHSKAQEVLDDIATGTGGRPFDWIKTSHVLQLGGAMRNERPQVAALILAHLSPSQSADVMSQLPEETQGKVAHKLTSMRPVAPEIVRAIDEALRERFSKERKGSMRSVGGLQSLVTILNNADKSTESKILEYLQKTEAETAESVRGLMFVFEDIVKLDDRAMQVIIREVDQEDLRLGLKGASEEIKQTFFRNMSERAVEVLKEDLEMMGAVKLRDVESARRRVIGVVHRLDEVGEISLRPDEEEVVT
jgi:flagellar motor switch protein FliG